MPYLDTLILGDNPITFTISFLINLILLWYIWSIVRPMKDENLKLKGKLDEKDGLIEDLNSDKKILSDVLEKIMELSDYCNSNAALLVEYKTTLEKMYDRTRALLEDGKVCREELRDIERTLTGMANSIDNINHKQTITQSLLIRENHGYEHGGVTGVK